MGINPSNNPPDSQSNSHSDRSDSAGTEIKERAVVHLDVFEPGKSVLNVLAVGISILIIRERVCVYMGCYLHIYISSIYSSFRVSVTTHSYIYIYIYSCIIGRERQRQRGNGNGGCKWGDFSYINITLFYHSTNPSPVWWWLCIHIYIETLITHPNNPLFHPTVVQVRERRKKDSKSSETCRFV
jgi:hypothetical protein